MKIEEQFEERDNKFFCKICEKSYKNIKKKDGKYRKLIINHYKTKCEKKRTRNHIKCQNNEKNVKKYYEKIIKNEEIINFPNSNEKYLVLNIEKIRKERKNSKNDIILKLKNIRTNKIKLIGIQIKSYNYGSYENWPSYNNLSIIDNSILKDLLIDLKNNYKKFQNDYEKYKKKNKNSKFVNFCLNIVPNSKNKKEITSIKLKEDFIKRLDNPVDDFYYYIQINNINFQHEDLKYVDYEFIKNKKMYILLRPVYTSSGNTSLSSPNIFNYLEEEEKIKIPLIIMKKISDTESEIFFNNLIEKYK